VGIGNNCVDVGIAVTRWTAVCGLEVNPEKTELVIFTREYKIPNLTLPKLHQTRLTLINQAKYLGVILDKKLHWTDSGHSTLRL